MNHNPTAEDVLMKSLSAFGKNTIKWPVQEVAEAFAANLRRHGLLSEGAPSEEQIAEQSKARAAQPVLDPKKVASVIEEVLNDDRLREVYGVPVSRPRSAVLADIICEAAKRGKLNG